MKVTASIRRWWSRQEDSSFSRTPEPPTVAGDPPGRGAERPSDVAPELPHLLQALQLDPHALHEADPAAMQAMRQACAACRSAAACRADLCSGIARKRYRLYCPNAGPIDALMLTTWSPDSEVSR